MAAKYILVEGDEGSVSGSEEGVPVEQVPDVRHPGRRSPGDRQQVVPVPTQHVWNTRSSLPSFADWAELTP